MDVLPTTLLPLAGASPAGPYSGVYGAPLSPIIGRGEEVREIVELIDRDTVRVVTLLGPGGVGKTRLAHAVLTEIAPVFAHGGRFVALDAIRDPALVPAAVARSLGLQESDPRPAENLLADYLNHRHMLLVLDNMEQVIGAASPWLANLLRQAPRLTVLVTSRIPLNIDGEHHYLVPPLETPDTDAGASAAVRLFAERAGEVRHDFALNDESLGVVAEICRRLDGLPLAIELAAARMKVLSPDALLARLTNRLTLLTGGHRDAPPRLRSMRDAIAWSYDLLSPDEQRLFRRLSVFLGGFTLDAVEFVAAWPDPPGSNPAALDLLQSLVDQSLIRAAPAAAGFRYRMLETIREYGAEQAEHLADIRPAEGHAAYILDLARRAEPELSGPEQASWLDRLDADFANIRGAVSWLENRGRLGEAIAIYASVILFVDVRGHAAEVVNHLERWLELPELRERTHSRGLALYATGVMLHYMGDFTRGTKVLEEATGILVEVDDVDHAAIACAWAGVTCAFMGDDASAVPLLEESVALAREAGNHRALALGLAMLGGIGRAMKDEQLYRTSVDQAARIAREHGDWWMICYTDLAADLLDALDDGRFADAEKHIREGLRIRTMIGSKRDLPLSWIRLAWAAHGQGDLPRAEEYLATALRIAEETSHGWFETMAYYDSAIVAAELGDLSRAQARLAMCLDQFPTNHHTGVVADCLAAYAMIASLAGDAPGAARFLGAAERLFPDMTSGQPEPGFWIVVLRRRAHIVAALTEREFREAYETGAAWTVDEAIAEALRYQLPSPNRAHDLVDEPPTPGGLSPRELDVLAHMAKGMSNRQIADALFVSHRTVTTHVTHIMTKLDASSRTAAVSFAIRNGMA